MSETATSLGEHPRCPWCQYDLFGLPQEEHVVRCPECGNRVDLRLFALTLEERKKRVYGMESLPAACAGLALFAVLLAMLGVPRTMHAWNGSQVQDGCVFVGLALGCCVGWWACARAYLRRYRFVVGAVRVLVLFHVCLFLFLFGIPCVSGALLVMSTGLELGGFLACPGSLLAIGLGAWLYRRARGIPRNMHDQLVCRDGEPPRSGCATR